MNLKKTFTVCLVLFAVLTLAVVSAGCVDQNAGNETGTDVPDIVGSVAIEKLGITYSIGDTMEVIFRSLPNWLPLRVNDSEEGISIEMNEIPAESGDKELKDVIFTVTALRDGNYSFSIGIPSDTLDEIAYEDTVHIVNTGAEPVTPRGVFTVTWSGIDAHPYVGKYYDISVRGNATTGYQWVAAENPDLIIADAFYIPDEAAEGMVGIGGMYHWYVTAETAGYHQFTAYNMPPGKDEPEGRIIVPVILSQKPN